MKLIDIAEIKTGFNLTRKKAQLSQDIVENYNYITLKSFVNFSIKIKNKIYVVNFNFSIN